MKKNFAFLFVCISFYITATAQVSYDFTALTGTYSPLINGTIPSLVSPDFSSFTTPDEGFANSVPIGFTFIYNGVAYTDVNINANGFITFGEDFIEDPNEAYYVNSLKNGPLFLSSVRPVIAPLWDDLDLAVDDSLTYLSEGTAPNRVFTVQWANAIWRYNAASPGISFQVKLYETTNVIEFIYRQEAGALGTPSASIGISGTGAGNGNFLSLTNSSASPGISSTTETSITAKPATGQVYRFTPMTCIAPSVTQLSNITSTSATLSWNAIPGASGYEYATSTSATPPGSGTSTASTSVNISGLTAGVNNYLYVRTACGGGSFSAWSSRAIVICTTNVLPANGATVTRPPTISWNAVTGATGYSIMLSTDGTTYFNIGTVSGATTSTPINNLNNNTTYSFYVRPVIDNDTASVSCQSNATTFIIGAAPVIPCTTNILPANGATVDLPPTVDTLPVISWNPISGATEYDIMLSTDGTNFDELGSVPDTVTSIPLHGLDYATTYYFYIRPIVGLDTASVSCASNATSFTTSAAPSPPVNDSCGAATNISVLSGVVSGTTYGATGSPVGGICPPAQNDPPSDPDDDVWYTFTAINNGSATITVSGGSFFDAVVSVYTGTCSNLTLLDCADNTLDGDVETLTLNSLQSGQTYYLRIYDWGTRNPGNFTVSLSGSALPVTMGELHGKNMGSANLLEWTTQTEINNKGFELQRSANGSDFSPLDFIVSKTLAGNSTSALTYSYTDVDPLQGNSYYKLKQIDKDGKFLFSNIVLLKTSGITQVQLNNVYPNPSKTVLNVSVASPSNSKISLVITDIAGKTVLTQRVSLVSGNNILKVNVAKLAVGSYLLKGVCAEGCKTAVRKFVKQ